MTGSARAGLVDMIIVELPFIDPFSDFSDEGYAELLADLTSTGAGRRFLQTYDALFGDNSDDSVRGASIDLSGSATTVSGESAMSESLFMAVLAMDAYNRGPSGVFSGTLPYAVGTQIGKATITNFRLSFSLSDIFDPNYDVSETVGALAGFQAIAYSWNGKTVVSYRGTDEPLDVAGWLQGAGFRTFQSAAAESFYERVTGRSVLDQTASDIILTGHSLGGGLAGYIAALTHGKAYVFDNMPYEASAVNRILDYNLDRGLAGVSAIRTFLNSGTSGSSEPLPSTDDITSIAVSGEVLDYLRDVVKGPIGYAAQGFLSASIVADHLSGFDRVLIPVLGVLGADAAKRLASSETEILLPSHQTALSAVSLHSQSLLVLLQFADQNDHTAWTPIAEPLLGALFDDAVAAKLGAGHSANEMGRQIAYSVIDEGFMPFGNTAVHALFDDANELGRLYASGTATATYLNTTSVKANLSSIAVEYAGLLAKADDENAANKGGVLSYDPAAGVILLDTGASAWGSVEVYNEAALIRDLAGGITISAAAEIDHVLAGTSTSGTTIDVSGAAFAGSDVFIVTSTADDTITTGSGSSFVSLTGGTDTVTLGTGDDRIHFAFAPNTGNAVTLTGFSADDMIWLSASKFAGMGSAGAFLDSRYFWSGSATTGQTADSRMIYDTSGFGLYYDADAAGAGNAIKIAQFDGAATLASNNFWLV